MSFNVKIVPVPGKYPGPRTKRRVAHRIDIDKLVGCVRAVGGCWDVADQIGHLSHEQSIMRTPGGYAIQWWWDYALAVVNPHGLVVVWTGWCRSYDADSITRKFVVSSVYGARSPVIGRPSIYTRSNRPRTWSPDDLWDRRITNGVRLAEAKVALRQMWSAELSPVERLAAVAT